MPLVILLYHSALTFKRFFNRVASTPIFTVFATSHESDGLGKSATVAPLFNTPIGSPSPDPQRYVVRPVLTRERNAYLPTAASSFPASPQPPCNFKSSTQSTSKNGSLLIRQAPANA